MKVKLGTICRGSGMVYIKATVALASTENALQVSAQSESGTTLPVEFYPAQGQMGAAHAGAPFDVVLVTPQLDTKAIAFAFNECTPEGAVVASQHKKMSRESIKWNSRLNYRLHSVETTAIRGIESKAMVKQISFDPLFYIPFNDKFRAKGFFRTPAQDPNPTVTVLNANGTVNNDLSVELGPQKEITIMGVPYLECSFSFLAGEEFCGCLVATGSNDTKSAFLCFDGPNKWELRDKTPRHYRIGEPDRYPQYLDFQRRVSLAQKPLKFPDGPILFSIVVPLYKTPINFFNEMIQSVLDQTYKHWELILVNASPEDENLCAAVAAQTDERIKVVTLKENLGIADNTNEGILAAKGDFVCLFDHDDLLEASVLYEYAKVILEKPETDALYCDEDLYNENGEYVLPHFKSDFNIDLLRQHNYVTHFLVVRREIAQRLLENKEFDGAQDYDFILRVSEETQNIEHVSKVLYHWRMHANSTAGSASAKSYADEAGRKALQKHLDRCGLKSQASLTKNPFIYHVDYEIVGNPLVSIIIPNKDNQPVLQSCIDSIFEKSTYRNFEIIIVENNSETAEVFDYYAAVQAQHDNVQVITWEKGFNYSAINNFGATFAHGDYLLLLNNDTEVIAPNWLEGMVSYCQREDVGIVGAKLLYPDNTVQHAGVIMERCAKTYFTAGPVHIFIHLDKDDGGVMGRASLIQDLSAVTAACLMVKRSIFEELGGLDENYVVAYNDVDFCLRVRELGYKVVYNPDVLLYHYESLTRGGDTDSTGVDNFARFLAEQGMLRARWSRYYALGDPYHGRFSTLELD